MVALLLVPGLGPPGPLEREAMTKRPEIDNADDGGTAIPCCRNEENSPTKAGWLCPSIENVLWLCCCRRHRRVYWLLSKRQRGNQRQPTNQHSCKAFLKSPPCSRNLPSSGSNLLCRKLRAIHAGLHQLSRSGTT